MFILYENGGKYCVSETHIPVITCSSRPLKFVLLVLCPNVMDGPRCLGLSLLLRSCVVFGQGCQWCPKVYTITSWHITQASHLKPHMLNADTWSLTIHAILKQLSIIFT
ncbi:hypothetical protein CHS0354_007236 [Potamilus streckersoni]|uniref:Uncharacterized protein n=1 Tax=Potamilus streckersoni TaxID=2493646 RepID=A0AAE0VKP5_9BIVA|nr:hypothetical protein CHS0354_007236 [Potamilus streckersoni]